MILEIRELDFNLIDIIDTYESFIWTERYAKYGDFEVHLIPTTKIIQLAQIDRLVTIAESSYVMFIEQVELKTSPSEGNSLIISGRSFESLLTRRVIWPVFNKNLKLIDYIKELMKACFQPESYYERMVLITYDVESSEELSKANENMITAQHTGDNLYDVVGELCDIYKIGYRFEIVPEVVTYIDSSGVKEIIKGAYHFILYAGKDRSYTQMKVPWIVFSPAFNNVGNTDDLKSVKEYMTMAYVAGEDTQPDRAWTAVIVEEPKNAILRRELFVDARDLQSSYRDENGEEHKISESEYEKLMKARGNERLQNYQKYHDYQAAVDTNVEHVYGVDYFLGDVVQIVNEYGVETQARVVEFIRSDGPEGYTQYPTFEIVDQT